MQVFRKHACSIFVMFNTNWTCEPVKKSHVTMLILFWCWICSNFLSVNLHRTSWLLPSIQLLPIASPLQWRMWAWFINTKGLFQGRSGWQENMRSYDMNTDVGACIYSLDFWLLMNLAQVWQCRPSSTEFDSMVQESLITAPPTPGWSLW